VLAGRACAVEVPAHQLFGPGGKIGLHGLALLGCVLVDHHVKRHLLLLYEPHFRANNDVLCTAIAGGHHFCRHSDQVGTTGGAEFALQ
jgi:hypothetical protein